MKLRLLIIMSLLSCTSGAAETTLIDPTQPSGHSQPAVLGSAAPASWQLTATHITPYKRLAIINGTQVAEGGRIGNARVLNISHAQVRLDAQGDIITLRLVQSEVRKTR